MGKNLRQLVVGPIATNCWIYQIDENSCAVIDPGDEHKVITGVLRELSLAPKFILLSHGHFDHIAALPELAASFPEAQIAIHRLDGEYLGAQAYAAHSLSIKAAMGSTSYIDAFWPDSGNSMPEATRLLEDGESIGPFTVLHLPGHTRGSAAFWDKEEGVLFTGDTLFKSGYGRTDLPGGSEEQLIKSLRRLFAMDKGITVCPGHGGTTTIGNEAGQGSCR